MLSRFIKSIFICVIALNARAQTLTVDVSGTISSEKSSRLQGAVISVTKDGKHFTSFPTSFEGTYHLYLPLGSEYEVNVAKKNYVHKVFTVNTMGVPYNEGRKKFSDIIADVELIAFQEGVDYSLLDQPMNKFYYNSKKEDFEYDREYCKSMLALVEQIKEANKEAVQLAKQAEEKLLLAADLAKQKMIKDELLAIQTETFKRLNDELAKSSEVVAETKTSDDLHYNYKPDNAVLTADALYVNPNKNERVAALLIKYKPGVTEEVFIGEHVIIIQRILVSDDMAWVYQKKMFDWGGISYFRDGQPITESTFEIETKAS